MNYPHGRCQNCGDRLYAHVTGNYQCLNCNRRYPPDVFDAPTVSSGTDR